MKAATAVALREAEGWSLPPSRRHACTSRDILKITGWKGEQITRVKILEKSGYGYNRSAATSVLAMDKRRGTTIHRSL